MRWIWLVFLIMAAWSDVRTRSVSVCLLAFPLLPGIIHAFSTGIAEHLAAAAAGLLLLLISRATDGSLGEGDALFFLMSACYFDLAELAMMFIMSLCIGGLWSMVIIMKNRLRGTGCRGETVPFLACVLLPGIWTVCR